VCIIYILVPNPAFKGIFKVFFRIVLAFSIVYVINLTFLIILDFETIRNYLVLIDSNLGKKIVERDYSQSCAFYTPENPESNFFNLMNTIDVYVLAHLFGWFLKTLIFRNSLITWTLSIAFELYEISLKHILPNFHECWWDQLLLDLFGCNLLGIIFGNLVLKYFNIKTHHWFFEPTEESMKLPYFKRFLYPFK